MSLYTCGNYWESCLDADALDIHLDNDNCVQLFKCDICHIVFENMNFRDRHGWFGHELRCCGCGRRFPDERSLNEYVKQHMANGYLKCSMPIIRINKNTTVQVIRDHYPTATYSEFNIC